MGLRIGLGVAVAGILAGVALASVVIAFVGSGLEMGGSVYAVNGGWAIVGSQWGLAVALLSMTALWLAGEIRAVGPGERGGFGDGIERS